MKQSKVKLIEVKSTKTQEEIDNEQMKQMIQDKLNIFENIASTDDSYKQELYAGALEDKLELTLKKIYNNGELDNKQKIEQMIEFYNTEVLKEYRGAFESVIKVTSDHTMNEFLSEYNTE